MSKIRWPLMKNAILLPDRLKLAKFLLTSDRYTNGPVVKDFESRWANWVGSRYALMVSSGSTANLLLLAAVKELHRLKAGDKVLVPACTWVTNISPVIQLGFEPIFCDVNLRNFSFDIDHMKQIKEAHPDIKVVFVTHLLGLPAEVEKYKRIFPEAIFLDDVCESHGVRDEHGSRVGQFSYGSTFSFYFGHHMTTIEGGMVNTSNPDLYDLMKMKRSHGLAREAPNAKLYQEMYPDIDPSFLFMTDGYNLRSTELNAVLGIEQLKRLDKNIEIRRRNHKMFIDIINSYPSKFMPVQMIEGNSSYAFPIISISKLINKTVKDAFKKNGIEYRPIISGNLLRQPFLKNYTFGTPRYNANVDVVHDNGLYIGNSQFITESDMKWLDKVLGAIHV